MSEKEFDDLHVGSFVYNEKPLASNNNIKIPAGTTHVVTEINRRPKAEISETTLITMTYDKAGIKCAFLRAWALQLLQTK